MAEYVMLGVDAIVTAALYGWYKSSRRNAELVKNAPNYEIGPELQKALLETPDNKIPYGCIEGITAPVNETLKSQHGAAEGLIQLLQFKEHKSKRSQGFWSDAVKVIKDLSQTVPFTLFRPSDSSGSHVDVQQPLEALYLKDELTTTYHHFEPAKVGFVERGMERLFGEVSKGYEETEEMLQIGTTLLGIGELVFSNSKIKLQSPSPENGIYILSKHSKSEIIRRLESQSTVLKVVTAIFGIAGVVILCVIMRKWYRRWKEYLQIEWPLQQARSRREQHRRQQSADGENSDEEIDSNTCVICLTNPREVVLLHCGHICACADCVEALPEPICPICRSRIERVVSTYLS